MAQGVQALPLQLREPSLSGRSKGWSQTPGSDLALHSCCGPWAGGFSPLSLRFVVCKLPGPTMLTGLL